MLEHRFSVFLVFATLVLLWIGGTVNPTGSSLACPEPTLICNGELFPPMTGGVLYEHGHRLVATSVGILQIIVTILLWRRRPALRSLGVLALAMVCGQGALGAFTVAYKLPWVISTLHLFTAFAYLSLLMFIAWRTAPPTAASRSRMRSGARSWIIAAVVAVLLQILLGGLVRHHEASLASVSLPFHNGSIWPSDAVFTIKLQMAHRIGGVLVALITLVAAIAVFRRAAGSRLVRALSVSAVLLVAAQVALGVWVIASFRSTPIAVLHFATASVLWCVWVSLALLARPPSRALGHLESDGALQ